MVLASVSLSIQCTSRCPTFGKFADMHSS
jgi:hypothetical protein